MTDDMLRSFVEDYIAFGIETGKFSTVDDAPNIDAWFETMDRSGDVLPQGLAVKIEGVPRIRGRYDR